MSVELEEIYFHADDRAEERDFDADVCVQVRYFDAVYINFYLY